MIKVSQTNDFQFHGTETEGTTVSIQFVLPFTKIIDNTLRYALL